ncbi:p-type atpase phosphorylation site [Trichococcus palustris]|uniref:Magnesium-transporting ATPase, P-type 1 n=2 Tax=Trichococcus palustris TaxID=140314 RepID=A0A143YIG2_9LACT|nr:p-type atpase phosphorylation site [Trichococcus palustris]SFL10914.1 Mg2+-importing ATPase [Trichococcus palustris]
MVKMRERVSKKIAANKAAEQNERKMQRNEKLRFAATNAVDAVLNKLDTTPNGLSEEAVEENRTTYGENVVTKEEKKGLLKRITEAFINPFTVILIFLAAVSAFTDIYLPLHAGTPEEVKAVTVVIILTMVIISGVLRFVQEARSGDAAEKLLAMITTTTCVERQEIGKQEIPLEEVVVGDIIYLAAGDMVPADIRIMEAKDLFISQASLTGESESLEKTPALLEQDVDSVTESPNLAFMGTTVISGSARAIVIATGDNTIFGSMAQSIAVEPVETSFEKGVNEVSWILIRFMLIMVPIVFFVNGVTKQDWTHAFLFAISIAVGLTPEMLPMIVTTSLAKGAVSMSKKKTIIKNLNSMQNFGAIDVLCTDKTGTLTMDKVVLEQHMDVHGNKNVRVLRHAFLNSYFQTGLKNLMDISIIEHTKKDSKHHEELKALMDAFKKVDEIPFDFSRRRMSVVVADKNGKTQMITKGAVEEILSICTYVEYKGKVERLTEEVKEDIIRTVDDLNDDGMRVIAVAQKNNPSPVGAFGVKDECEMVLIGYLAFLDPPKETTKKAIQALLEYGVTTKILTGDNDKVTRSICRQVGLEAQNILLGSDLEKMDDSVLREKVEITTVFAKLSPDQKVRVVEMLRENGHTVGFMGDGINDAAAMKAADIGISVDTAVDIAKESADVILLEKDLMVLEEGIIEGRKTYANMIKYIKMTASSNFGNMFSVLVASAFIPFLPMMSVQLILLNLIYDISCTTIPWDNVDTEFLKKPRTWNAASVSKFMVRIGPISSIFDISTYLLMYFVICPMFTSNGVLFTQIPTSDVTTRALYIAMFQAGWFIESMWSQTLVIHMIRTPKIPFIQSRASFPVITLTTIGIALVSIIPFTPLGSTIGLTVLPGYYWPFLAITVILYMLLVTGMKKIYIKRFGEWL